MKKHILITAFILSTSITLIACGSTESSTDTTTEPTNVEFITFEDSEITLPAGLAGTEVSEDNVVSVDDTTGDITYALTGSERTEIVNSLASEIDASISAILADKDYYPDIVSITPNSDYTVFTIELTGSTANIYESMLSMSFYTIGNKYQIYTGTDASKALTTVVYVDSSTGETIATGDSSSMN
jgi:hypothetical protein